MEKKYTVTKEDLLLDLRLMSDGVFEGEVREENCALVIKFTNGQTFRVFAEETKSARKVCSNIRQIAKDVL